MESMRRPFMPRRPVLTLSLLLALVAAAAVWPSLKAGTREDVLAASGGTADTFFLSDEPGNWFRSAATGTPVSLVPENSRVDFKINGCCTNTRHTVTLLVKPVGSQTEIDQDQSQNGTLSADFDLPGVYILHC